MSQASEEQQMQELELANLKQRATLLGIQFHPSIGAKSLREKIEEHRANEEAPEVKPAQTEAEKLRAKRSAKMKEAKKLVRCMVHCSDPNKREWPGEVITVSNSLVGTIKRYVPYGSEQPTHVEQIIFNVLAEKRVQIFTTKPGKHGIPVRKAKSIPAYGLTVLPPLTKEELETLAKSQALRNATGDDD